MKKFCGHIGMAWIAGCLYEVNGYPGLVLNSSGSSKVYGELYRLVEPNTALALLDDYEGCSSNYPQPHEYVRKQLPVYDLEHKLTVMANLYVFNWPIDKLRKLPFGDYCRFPRHPL